MLTPRAEKRRKMTFSYGVWRDVGEQSLISIPIKLTDETEEGSYGGKWGHELGLLVFFFKVDPEVYLC